MPTDIDIIIQKCSFQEIEFVMKHYIVMREGSLK